MKTIEFSGVDGSGKTTAMGHFCDELKRLGARVLVTREVGSPHVPVCAKLRELILDPSVKMDGRSMELVFSAMRVENQRFYASVKDMYDFCVSDRGWLCHLAYNDVNTTPEFTKMLYTDLMAKITDMPDLVFLFDVDPDEAASRIGARDKPTDSIEIKGAGFQLEVARMYRKHASDATFAVVAVDSNRPEEMVANEMRQIALKLWG